MLDFLEAAALLKGICSKPLTILPKISHGQAGLSKQQSSLSALDKARSQVSRYLGEAKHIFKGQDFGF